MTQTKEFPLVRTSDLEVTISVGQTISSAADMRGTTLVGIEIPVNFSGTALEFQVDRDGSGTFLDYYATTGNKASMTVTAATAAIYGIVATDFVPVRRIKLVSGTSQAGTDAVIKLITRGSF